MLTDQEVLALTPQEALASLARMTPRQATDWEAAQCFAGVRDSQLLTAEDLAPYWGTEFPWPELPRFLHAKPEDCGFRDPPRYDDCMVDNYFINTYYNLDDDLIAAGGALADGISGHGAPKSFDFYVIGPAGREKAVKLLRDVFYTYNDTCYLSKGLCHVQDQDGIEYNINLCEYPSKAALLYSFEVGSLSVAYNGKQIWFTLLGAIAHLWHVNLVDPRCRSREFEIRLANYNRHGFALGLIGGRGFDGATVYLSYLTLLMQKVISPFVAIGIVWNNYSPAKASLSKMALMVKGFREGKLQNLKFDWESGCQVYDAILDTYDPISAICDNFAGMKLTWEDFKDGKPGEFHVALGFTDAEVKFYSRIVEILGANSNGIIYKEVHSRIDELYQIAHKMAPVKAGGWWIDFEPNNRYLDKLHPLPLSFEKYIGNWRGETPAPPPETDLCAVCRKPTGPWYKYKPFYCGHERLVHGHCIKVKGDLFTREKIDQVVKANNQCPHTRYHSAIRWPKC